ncbi:GNAT family N-acetyltransferase [Nocardiopsis protaetiae]|uniref:GNAT family N-acetyltransferase n=1 Tax=Nocardiopsis protaetiae TaxID=3382270 RepID=UPI00387AB1DC
MSDRTPTPGPCGPTTTHAGWGAGDPRLFVTGERDRYVHGITGDLTRIGSSVDNDIVLAGADPLHATITHDATDEYVLTMFGRGGTNAATRRGTAGRRRPSETLRTGAHFTAGPWRLVFARDEFADHGRPYGGRQGGEFSHQRAQPPRPDYTFGQPLSEGQAILVDAVVNGADAPAFEFYVVRDERTGIYNAMAGDSEIGGLSYSAAGEDRLVLLELSVLPVYREQGIATDLIRRVLDDVRAHGRTVTILCPIVRTFIGRNPEYADLVDPDHPGGAPRSDGS